MPKNTKQTSSKIASKASKVLRSKGASAKEKSLAASALAQSGTGKQTGKAMECKAAKAVFGKHSSKTARELAGSVLSQSNKAR